MKKVTDTSTNADASLMGLLKIVDSKLLGRREAASRASLGSLVLWIDEWRTDSTSCTIRIR
jgi:hypothetical protein